MRFRSSTESAGAFCIGVSALAFILTAFRLDNRALVALIASIAVFQLGLTLLIIGKIPEAWGRSEDRQEREGTPTRRNRQPE